MDILRGHPQQNLAGAAELPELLKDEPDHLLQPAIRIEVKTDMAVPDIADWRRDSQLAAPRFRSRRVVHPGSNDPQLDDAALHAEQQAVVGAARIIDAVEVDYAGFHKSTQFEQMVPVAAIAREPRCIKAQDRANLPRTQGSNQTIKARALDGATCRAPKIVVDDLDVGETAPARHIDQLVLASLALQVRLHLLRRGLANIDDGLALQHGRREEAIMRRHRRPRSSRCRLLRAAVEPVPGGPLGVAPQSRLGGGRRRERGRAGAVPSEEQTSVSGQSPLSRRAVPVIPS